MPAIRGITVSVGYGPLLRITLPRNMRHLTECLVVTSPDDRETQEVASSVPGVRLHVTDAATRHQARFNKGLCFEEAWDHFGRDGWWLVHDSDIILPDSLHLDQLKPDHLHGARRRILEDPSKWSPDLDWRVCPLTRDGSAVGFFQLFHADDPALSARPHWYDASDPNLVGGGPWYDVSFAHAGGGDAAFMDRWSRNKIKILPVDCLHLGPVDRHWYGVSPEGKDITTAFMYRRGYRRGMRGGDPSAVHRVGEIVERVDVPGYPVSKYDLPFVRRAKAMRQP